MCPAQWAWVALIALLGVTAMLASCGQRGPLVPPEPRETPRAESGAPVASPATAPDAPASNRSGS